MIPPPYPLGGIILKCAASHLRHVASALDLPVFLVGAGLVGGGVAAITAEQWYPAPSPSAVFRLERPTVEFSHPYEMLQNICSFGRISKTLQTRSILSARTNRIPLRGQSPDRFLAGHHD